MVDPTPASMEIDQKAVKSEPLVTPPFQTVLPDLGPKSGFNLEAYLAADGQIHLPGKV